MTLALIVYKSTKEEAIQYWNIRTTFYLNY
nr:MAG TPA: restriction alleviation protein [Crassvirales sp.]